MGKIIISENITLDGVVQDPTGDEGFRYGGWFGQVGNKDREEWAKVELDEALGADALLLGRRTYEFFAARWPSRSGQWADRLNRMPKYVVSATLQYPDWSNTTVLTGDVADAVSALCRKVNGDIIVYASFQLVRSLWEHGLIDELRLIIYPFVLGAGQRLFAETGPKRHLRLIDTRTVGDGLAFLSYRPEPIDAG
jgi:dihydrofolate reductase